MGSEKTKYKRRNGRLCLRQKQWEKMETGRKTDEGPAARAAEL
jgi:hypothetical protein